jgi:hypothetical protein
MFIKSNPAIQNKIQDLVKVHQFNMDFSDRLIKLFFNQASLLHKLNRPYQGQTQEINEDTLIKSAIKSNLSKNLINIQPSNLLDVVIDEGVKGLSAKTYVSNPFYQHMKMTFQASGKWQLVQESYKPYQPIICGDVITDAKRHYLDITPIGYFKEPFSFVALKENDVTWMSLTPFEMETMAAGLNAVSGTVVALGLGMGYFASMAAMKTNVNQVIVVEKDKRVIELYTKHIQPFIPHQNKITIVQSDAFTFLNQKVFADHIFVDIYRTAEDGLPLYIAFKKIEKKLANPTWHYWLEDSILGLFRRYLMIYLKEQHQGFGHEHYQSSKTFEDTILSEIHRINQDLNIESVTQLQSWLSKNSIKEMLTTINNLTLNGR